MKLRGGCGGGAKTAVVCPCARLRACDASDCSRSARLAGGAAACNQGPAVALGRAADSLRANGICVAVLVRQRQNQQEPVRAVKSFPVRWCRG
jgi:hypothetical protein